MLRALVENMQRHRGNISRDIETQRKNQKEIQEMKLKSIVYNSF